MLRAHVTHHLLFISSLNYSVNFVGLPFAYPQRVHNIQNLIKSLEAVAVTATGVCLHEQ